ncbi:cytochrome P450 [Neolentinus lepideus HHB14362 ss-1]|uniref:Cytochrome P450 n=1 Tax=Neolentinus lepideus HHB14362 ss-1 TaxID=1314782 RepID=A0A165N659_9AGAM|nr:cytochrome P450 [Neolentinus lepideus HHB14362 ss-1]
MTSNTLASFVIDRNHSTIDLLVAVSGVLLYFALKQLTTPHAGQSLPLPPGPPLKPFIGNILSVPRDGQWELFTEYKCQYGELIYLHGLGNKILILNSMEAVNDLLDKRGHIYSHLPVFTMIGELMALEQSMPLLPYGKEWCDHRKLVHAALSPSAIKYHPIQEELAAMMCKDFLDNPEDFFSHVRLTAGQIFLSVTYRLTVGTADDQYITHAEDTMAVIGEATVPGTFLCDLLPIFKYLPSWVPFQQEAKKGKYMIDHLVTMPFNQVKREMLGERQAIILDNAVKYPATEFKLERFLDEPQTVLYPLILCPGKHLGENSVNVLITSILQYFNILPPLNGELAPAFGWHLLRSEAKAELLWCTVVAYDT